MSARLFSIHNMFTPHKLSGDKILELEYPLLIRFVYDNDIRIFECSNIS